MLLGPMTSSPLEDGSDGCITDGPVHFDPDKHLAFVEPSRAYTMEDLGLPGNSGVSPIAVCEPFQLFSEEAIDIMREEVLAEEVQRKYQFSSDIAAKQIRGYAPKHGKFTYEAWKHPRTLALISKIAGVDLVPAIDYEIGHVNMSAPKLMAEEHGCASEEKPIVGWHRDSYPFVCVLMLSDTSGMVGGETALRTGGGTIMKVRGPTKGCAAVLQGRYIDHQALPAFNSQERITSVTSFRPRSAFIKDDTVLKTVRPISNLSALYGQIAEYQLENVEVRLRRILKVVRDSNRVGATNVKALKEFLRSEIETLAHLDGEIVEEERVIKGAVAMICEEVCVA